MNPGSSPHTRGAPGPDRAGEPPGRIIPAYAGSTSRGPDTKSRSPDHPRIRGEHLADDVRFNVDGGSSPHTRGAPGRRRQVQRGRGIIPAYAGSTCRSVSGTKTLTDHPRIRGEHDMVPLSVHFFLGSSPHTRGAPDRGPHESIRDGIIPAYAGSTAATPAAAPPAPNHPRIRGEHVEGAVSSSGGVGSSPHTRGAHTVADPDPQGRRIIPAYAGSTRRYRRSGALTTDHPRIRGEHILMHLLMASTRGSSPHTRGAPPTRIKAFS